MSYRPYPDVDRALAQIDRHYPDPPAQVLPMPDCLRPMTESLAWLRSNVRLAAAPPVDEYRLSTR